MAYPYQMGYQPQISYPPAYGSGYLQQQPVVQAVQAGQQSGQSQSGLLGRYVASREEALGVPVDYSGSAMFFPNLQQGVVYVKRFNPNTGAADFAEYRLAQTPEAAPEYATRQQVDKLTERLTALEDRMQPRRRDREKGESS